MKYIILLCLALLSGCASFEAAMAIPADWGPEPVGPFEFYHGPNPQVFLGKPWDR